MMKKTIMLFVLILNLPNIAFADIYKWKDEQGNVHATDDINQAPPEIQDKYRPKDIKSQSEPYVSKIPIKQPAYFYNPSPTSYSKVTEYWKDPETGRSYKLPVNEYQIKKDRQRIREEKKQLENAKATASAFFLLILLSVIMYICLWLWTFIDILKSQFEKNDKLVWWLTITLFPLIGMVAYATIGRKQRLIQEEPNYHEFYKDDPPRNNRDNPKEKICTAPRCYGVMQIRTAKDGKKYWVCSEYNKCKTAVAVEEAGA